MNCKICTDGKMSIREYKEVYVLWCSICSATIYVPKDYGSIVEEIKKELA